MAEEYTYRIEKEIEVMAYLQNLRYALDHGAEITFQKRRNKRLWFIYFIQIKISEYAIHMK